MVLRFLRSPGDDIDQFLEVGRGVVAREYGPKLGDGGGRGESRGTGGNICYMLKLWKVGE